MAFLRFEPSPNLLGYKKNSIEFSLVSANDFRRLASGSRIVDEDQETQRFSARYREGLKGGWEWSVEVPLLSRGGGFQDPIIDWWHANVLHWSDERRNRTPFGRCRIALPGSSFGSASGLGDVSFVVSKELAGGWILASGLKIPSGDSAKLLGSGGVDFGLYAQKRWPLNRRIALYGYAAWIAQGKAKHLDGARGLVHQEGLTLVWQRNRRDAWVLQWQGEASALETGVPGSDATHRLLTLGYKRLLDNRHILDLYISEDRDIFNGKFPEGANIGPDITLGARLNIRF